MKDSDNIPRILIIDDLFGRTHKDRRNDDRAGLCGQYLIEDVTGDEEGKGTSQKIKKPVAQAVFYRGQKPVCSTVGDTVENDLEGTLKVIADGWNKPPYWSLVLLDLCFYTGKVTEQSNKKDIGMPEGRHGDDDPKQYFGLRILEAINEKFPNLPVVILSSKPREDVSREFSILGAQAFIPRADEKGPELLRDYIFRYGLSPDEEGNIVGRSKPLLQALRSIRLKSISDDRSNILIRGETGTGKELFAEYIHRQRANRRANKSKFVPVNSAELLSDLWASALFGHRRGAFTGADKDRIGYIKESDGGELFFDEIQNMFPHVQAGILRALQERVIIVLGTTMPESVDVSFLSATNADIDALVAEGRFREDLLYRLRQGGTFFLPPLRERKEDIPLLVEKFVRDTEKKVKTARHRTIEPEVLDKLLNYNWPGNIRELESCISNAIENYPDVEHLVPLHIQIHSKTHKTMVAVHEQIIESKPPVFSPPTGITDIPAEINSIIQMLNDFSFETLKPLELTGKLFRLQSAYANFIAKYLKKALELNTRYPEGKFLIHPAMKLMTGDPELSATEAAAIIKRIFKINPEGIENLLADPLLKEAYEKAEEQRPSNYKKKVKNNEKIKR